MDHFEKIRKKEARQVKEFSKMAQKTHGLRAKLLNKKRFKEKVEMIFYQVMRGMILLQVVQ